jgi:hypothetical protein
LLDAHGYCNHSIERSHLVNDTTISKFKLAGAIAGALALGLVVYLIVSQVNSNKVAIEKGCILLNNAVIRSQAEAQREGSTTAVLVATIMDHASQERKLQFAAAVKRDKEQGNPLVVPCETLADHPDQIRAVPSLRTTTIP